MDNNDNGSVRREMSREELGELAHSLWGWGSARVEGWLDLVCLYPTTNRVFRETVREAVAAGKLPAGTYTLGG